MASKLGSYRLRLQRKRWRLRALRKRRNLKSVVNRIKSADPNDIVLICTVRNEMVLLPYFLAYYRRLGVKQFMFIDNGSEDGTTEFLKSQPDVSLWWTDKSYKRARFGIDWVNWLLRRYAHNRWVLCVDVDEFFVYPFCDTRPLDALTDWLDASFIRSFGSMVIDMYPRGRIDEEIYQAGQNPFDILGWFDTGNYTISRNPRFKNLWIQGGPRARSFFADNPSRAPALNKIPLVRWHRSFTYVSSTHMLLPRGLNLVYDEWGGEKASGCLLHAKFLHTFADRTAEELQRREHFANSKEYEAYASFVDDDPTLWCKWSEKYINWRQLEVLGLMSQGNWA